jgi:hypothetical protein
LALSRAGSPVAWWSAGPVPAAIEVSPLADPAGGLLARVAAPLGERVEIGDALGLLDTLRAGPGGAALVTGSAARVLTARVGAGAVEARSGADSLPPRWVAVLGRAGWESKFVVAALEERGWAVDARLLVAPGVAVTQGAPLPPDTARHAAVVALDSLDDGAARPVARYVQSGGGLVLGPEAARGRLAGMAPGRFGERVRAPTLLFARDSPRRALGYAPIAPRRGAVVLERTGPDVVVAARRAGAGRVVQLGYDDTWRWRLAGGDDAPEAHREWWAAVVVAAAYRAAAPGAVPTADPAPLAATYAALGPPLAASGRSDRAPDSRRLAAALAALCLAALLSCWASRRLRGAP